MTSVKVYLGTTTAILLGSASAFTLSPITPLRPFDNVRTPLVRLKNGWNDNTDRYFEDSNAWKNSNDDSTTTDDWETMLQKKQDGSYWSAFEPSDEPTTAFEMDDDEAEIRLDTLAVIQAEETTFNAREAQRADTARRMQEWGFDASTIASALDVSVEERSNDVQGMQSYRESSYLDSEDPTTVESHAKVPKDPMTQEPIRSQMVYVDEHACIGCTNCAMIAQSTFFMEEENGRARVFEQWGDDETTIDIAMETCPVDCIHYVPYEELVQLEVRRRDQYINVVAGLVSRAERGAGSGLMSPTPRSFGPRSFTNAPAISRGYTRGNEELEEKEKVRLLTAMISKLQAQRRRDGKIIDL